MFSIETQETLYQETPAETLESVAESSVESESETIDDAVVLDSESPADIAGSTVAIEGLPVSQVDFNNGTLLFIGFALALIIGILFERIIFRRLN